MTTYQERRERNTGIRFRTLGFMVGLKGGESMPGKNLRELKKLEIHAGSLSGHRLKKGSMHMVHERRESEEYEERESKRHKRRY